MKYCLVLFSLALCAASLQAQSGFTFTMNEDGKVIVIPRKKTYELKMPEAVFGSYTPASTSDLDLKMEEFKPDIRPIPDERPMNMQVMSTAYRPFFNVYAPMLRRMSPTAFDFDEVEAYALSDQFALVTYGRQNTFPGGGGITTINPMLMWESGSWSIGGGGFGGRYYTPFHINPGFTTGVNANVAFQATDWLKLRAWGQYAWYEGGNNKNAFVRYNPHFNQTSYGGAMEFKVTESFGVGLGWERQFNPMRGKWENIPLIYPIFFGK